MGSLEFGAKQAVVNCVKVQRGERVVIVTDLASHSVGLALSTEAKKSGGDVKLFVMEDFGARPDDGKNPIIFPTEIGMAMSGAQVSFYAAQSKIGEISSFRRPMRILADKHRLRHAHMIGITEEIMCQGMSADHNKIQELCRKLLSVVSGAREVKITTPAGSDFTIALEPKYKWIVFDGEILPGHWQNLPGGELFTAPRNAAGIVVVDGCLGDFFTEKYGDISATPLSYLLKDGRCVPGSVKCANATLLAEFKKYTFETDESSDRMGELGIGTNTGLTKLIGNLLQDEKFPGVHLALGDPYPEMTGADWSSKAHNDGVILKPTVTIDGKKIMESGVFLI